MATTYQNSRRDAIFSTLDDLSSDSDFAPREISSNPTLTAKKIAGATSNKGYRLLTAHANITSYSGLAGLHSCPKRFELDKYEANTPEAAAREDSGTTNLDFAFGHAVGAGIQTYATTNDLTSALFAAFIAWKAPWDAEKINKTGKATGKSLAWACHAVEKFSYFWNSHLSEYEVFTLPNGKPAVELSFSVDFENGYFHLGHIDTVLQHKETKRLVIWEGKTTAFEEVDDALFANSSQALGYSVVLDALSASIADASPDYEVYYIIYSSSSKEFQLLPFGKSRTQRAEWLQDILLDHASLSTYQKMNFYPRRGESCYDGRFRQRCKHFGTCTLSTANLFPKLVLPVISAERLAADVEDVDYHFKLSELIASQTPRTS